METQKIYWKEALNFLKEGKSIDLESLDFNNELIHWKMAQQLNDYGCLVPKELIDYDDDNIDFSDIDEVNDETLSNGTYRIDLPVRFDKDIAIWLKDSKIDYNKVINGFLRTVYESFKSAKGNEIILRH